MATPVNIMVKVNASPGLIADLANIAKADPSEIKLESVGPADESSHLRLGLAEVETLIAIINGTATFAKFSWAIYKHLKDNNSDQVTVQTPVHAVTISSSDAKSPQAVQSLLESAVQV